nr:agglutinin-like protein [Spathaspora passalidarum]
MAGNCPNGYQSGTLGYKIDTSGVKLYCEMANAFITNSLNAWYVPTSTSDHPFTSSCDETTYMVKYSNIPAGYRPFIDLFVKPPKGVTYYITYIDQYTCVGSPKLINNNYSTGRAGFANTNPYTDGREFVLTTRTYGGPVTQLTTLSYDPSRDRTMTIVVQVPIPTITITTTYSGETTSYSTKAAPPGGTATIIKYLSVDTVTETHTWTGSFTQSSTFPYVPETVETVTVRVEVPIPTITLTSAYEGITTLYSTITAEPSETATVIEFHPPQTVTETQTWTGIYTELTTMPYDPENIETVNVVELVPIPTTTVTSTYDGTIVSYTTVSAEPGETATVIKYHPGNESGEPGETGGPAETGEPGVHSLDTATATKTWTGSFTQTTTLPYDSEIDGTVSVVVEVPIPTVTSTTTYDGSTVSYTTVTAEPGETATIIEYHPSVYTGKAEILSGWESQLEAENPTSSHEFSGNKEEVTIQELQETQTEQSIISEQLLDTEGSLETEYLIETEEQSGTEEVLPTTILQNLPTEKPFETEESPESKAITSTEMLPRIQVHSESVIASEMEQPDYSEEYTKNQPPPSTDLSFDNEIPAQTHVSFVTEQAAKSGALGVDTVTETKTWTGEFTQIYTLPFDPELAETITVIVEIPIPTVTITSTYEGSTISYTTFTADPGDTATVIEFHPDEKTGEVEISPGWEQPFETESVPGSEEQFRTMEGSAYVLQETQIAQPVATEQVLEIEETLETKEVIFIEAIPEPQMLSNTEIFSETLQPYNTDEVVEPQVLTATEVPLDTEIVDQSEVLPVTETEGETGSYAVDTVTETRTWTGVFTQSYTLSFIPEVDETITVIVVVPIPTVTITSTYEGLTTSYTTIVAELGQTATIVEFVPENGSVFESSIPAETIKAETATIPEKPGVHSFDTVTETRTWTGIYTHSTTLPYNSEVDETVSVIIEVPIPTVTVTTTYDASVTSYTTVLAEPGLTATVIEFIPDGEESVGRIIDIVTVTRTWTGTFTQLTTLPFDPDIDKTISVIVQIPIPTVTVTREYTGTTVSYSTVAARPQGTSIVIVQESSGEKGVPSESASHISETGTITKTREWSSNFTKTTMSPVSFDIGKSATAIIDVPIGTVTVTSTYQGNTKSYTTVSAEVGEIATVIEFVPRGSGGAGDVSRRPVDMGSGVSTKDPTGSTETGVYNGISNSRASGNSGALPRPGVRISSSTTTASIRAGATTGAGRSTSITTRAATEADRSTGSATRAGTKTGSQPRGRSSTGTKTEAGRRSTISYGTGSGSGIQSGGKTSIPGAGSGTSSRLGGGIGERSDSVQVTNSSWGPISTTSGDIGVHVPDMLVDSGNGLLSSMSKLCLLLACVFDLMVVII